MIMLAYWPPALHVRFLRELPNISAEDLNTEVESNDI